MIMIIIIIHDDDSDEYLTVKCEQSNAYRRLRDYDGHY